MGREQRELIESRSGLDPPPQGEVVDFQDRRPRGIKAESAQQSKDKKASKIELGPNRITEDGLAEYRLAMSEYGQALEAVARAMAKKDRSDVVQCKDIQDARMLLDRDPRDRMRSQKLRIAEVLGGVAAGASLSFIASGHIGKSVFVDILIFSLAAIGFLLIGLAFRTSDDSTVSAWIDRFKSSREPKK